MENEGSRVGRRHFLVGLGSTAAALGVGGGVAGAAGSGDQDSAGQPGNPASASPPSPQRDLELDDIQGNVVAGFHQHHQAMVFISIPTASAGRAWLGALAPTVVSSAEVEAVRASFRSGESVPSSTWVNVAVSHSGLVALERPDRELRRFPIAFREGMAARSRRVGDTGSSAPSNWPEPYRQRIDAVVIVATDESADLAPAVERQRALATAAGVSVVHVQHGAARADEPGHEHFGFRDGVSQPGLRGFTAQQNPDDDGQGLPGQDLLWPGEFVLGYPRQAGVGGGDQPGHVARSGPGWTDNGSFLVFRRLTQDVAGFHSFIAETAAAQGLSEDLLGAKLVGRYKSGAPLTVAGERDVDPGWDDTSLLDEMAINDFEFEDDFEGTRVPLAAHIRKTYPRDQPTDDGGEEDTQTHRLLRRGIPFGESLVDGADPSPVFPNDRGLLFLAYQWSIERQFEHVQRRWVNDPDFPTNDAGQDPVIAQSPATGEFALPGGRPDHVALMARFVTTTGGEYFFQPSLSALHVLADGAVEPVRSGERPPGNDRERGRPPQRESGRRRG